MSLGGKEAMRPASKALKHVNPRRQAFGLMVTSHRKASASVSSLLRIVWFVAHVISSLSMVADWLMQIQILIRE